MIYCQTINVERIAVHPMDDMKSTQYVELTKCGDVPMFSVWMYDGEAEWLWEFEMYTPSDYERVKMNTFDAIFECDTMSELAEALDAVYRDGFEDILIVDECEECDGCCGGCNKSKQ